MRGKKGFYADEFKRLRESIGLSQARLGAWWGKTQMTIWSWETQEADSHDMAARVLYLKTAIEKGAIK